MNEEVYDDDLYGDEEEIDSEQVSAVENNEEELNQIDEIEEVVVQEVINQPQAQPEEEEILTPNFPETPKEPNLKNDQVLSEILFFGSISEAVQLAIKKQTFLLVILNGGNKESEDLLDRIKKSKEVQTLFGDLISLHLFTGTENFNHFIQIYPVFITPCIYLISFSGEPKLVLNNPTLKEIFEVKQIVDSCQSQEIKQVKEGPVDEDTRKMREEQERIALERKKKALKEKEKKIEKTSNKPKLTTEQKEKKEIEKKKEKLEKEKEKLYENELKLKIKREKEQRKKEAEEKAKSPTNESPKSPFTPTKQMSINEVGIEEVKPSKKKKVEKPVKKTYTTTEIAFRLPDGSIVKCGFKPSDPLSECREFVNSNFKAKKYDMVGYPKVYYTDEDLKKTLLQLSLVPNGTIILAPTRSNFVAPTVNSNETPSTPSTVDQSTGGFMSSICPETVSVVFGSFFDSIFGLFGSTQQSPSQESQNQSTSPVSPSIIQQRQENSQKEVNQSKKKEDQRTIVRRGNVRGFGDPDEDDSKKDTYNNGNSTRFQDD
eukprot:gene5468-9286_t